MRYTQKIGVITDRKHPENARLWLNLAVLVLLLDEIKPPNNDQAVVNVRICDYA